ncbi:MAG: hypothetical protein KA792_03745 [Bacteroidales bacterium]|nr:hypothetical protein [Bacteroidales bacterium]
MANKMIKIKLILYILLLSAIVSCYYDKEEDIYKYNNDDALDCDLTNVTYKNTIAPIMSASCNKCHSFGNTIATDNYNDLKKITDDNALWGTINHLSGYSPMPKGENKISDCNIRKIEKWIKDGANNN